MPANTPFAVVEGPRFTPLRYGLLSAAQPASADDHWRVGAMFQPDACGADRSVSAFCVAGGPATGTPGKVPTATGALSSAAEPFTVYAFVNCATVGFGDELEDAVARATRQMDAGEGRAAEKVFWTGVPDGGPVVHPHLAEDTRVLANSPVGSPHEVELQQAATVISGSYDLVGAFAALEGALAACYGGEGVIHVPAEAFAHLDKFGLLHPQGGQMRSALGNIVAGYASNSKVGPDGSTAAAGSAWMYATGAVQVFKGPVVPIGRKPADFVRRTDNTMIYLVERTFVLDWDCCLFAARGGFAAAVVTP